MNEGATKLADYLEFLVELTASGHEYFLEGGQAVNFWTEYLRSLDAKESLEPHRPFTSKGCDIWVDFLAMRHVEKRAGKDFVKSQSPADGQIGILTLDQSPLLQVDLLTNVFGLFQTELAQVRKRCLVFEGLRVIDTLYLLKSKCYCLINLPQGGRQDAKHVRMLSLIAPGYMKDKLNDARAGRILERAFIKEFKLLQKVLQDKTVRRALEQLDIDPNKVLSTLQLKPSGMGPNLKIFSLSKINFIQPPNIRLTSFALKLLDSVSLSADILRQKK